MNNFTDTFFNKNFISILSSLDIFSDLEFILSDLTLLEKIRKTQYILYNSVKAEQFML